MNSNEVERIAAAINRLRPDWPVPSIRTLINKHLLDRPRRDVAVALTWIACETASDTPGRVLESGPWWRAVAVDGDTTGRREPYDRTRTCDTCGRYEHPDTDHRYESVDRANNRRQADRPKPSLRELARREGDA